MIWSAIFLVSIVQGLFLSVILISKGSKNLIASRVMLALLAIMIIHNLTFFVIRTDLLYIIPQILGLSFGLPFLFGPLFYFYSKSIIDNSFKWGKRHLLHFIPYIVYFLLNFPAFFESREVWIFILTNFLTGNTKIELFELIFFPMQFIHLAIYLYISYRMITQDLIAEDYLIPISSRVKWIRDLFYLFVLFLFTLISLFVYSVLAGHYDPISNYFYTIISSIIIYVIAYKLITNRELVNPNFIQKYNSYKSTQLDDSSKYLEKLDTLMNKSQLFLNPDLTLKSLADEMGLTSNQLSKLINQNFKKSFNDYINEFRVKDFIVKVNDPKYKNLTIYAISLEVGFNSKSSFNSAFKKATGKTPSEYKIR